MREPSPNTIYFVWWPAARVMKVGYTDQSRWRIFEPRGAEVLLLRQFDSARAALDFESACHEALASACRPAFAGREQAKASELLGSQGGGWLECFAVPADLMGSELVEFCATAMTCLKEVA